MLDYFRKQNNMTMEDLGKAMGRTRSTISRWISGERYPKIEEVEQLVALFNTDTETLLFGGQNNNQSPPELIPLDKKLGDRIKEYREEKDLSQEFLAKALDISLNDLKAYEAGRKPFSVNMVFNFAMALNTSFDDLFPEDIEYDNVPAIVEINNEHNCIMTADGKKYTLTDEEMARVRNLLIFKNRK